MEAGQKSCSCELHSHADSGSDDSLNPLGIFCFSNNFREDFFSYLGVSSRELWLTVAKERYHLSSCLLPQINV